MPPPERWTAQKFFRELERRHVYRVAVGYLAIGWVLLEIITFSFERLGVSERIGDIILLVFILGFPIALILA